MEHIRVTKENPETEPICRGISISRNIRVSSKKARLAETRAQGGTQP